MLLKPTAGVCPHDRDGNVCTSKGPMHTTGMHVVRPKYTPSKGGGYPMYTRWDVCARGGANIREDEPGQTLERRWRVHSTGLGKAAQPTQNLCATSAPNIVRLMLLEPTAGVCTHDRDGDVCTSKQSMCTTGTHVVRPNCTPGKGGGYPCTRGVTYVHAAGPTFERTNPDKH